MMGLTIHRKAAAASIFDALAEFHTGRIGTLMLVHNESGKSYRVARYDPQTRQAHLFASNKLLLTPYLTEREAKLYTPVWR